MVAVAIGASVVVFLALVLSLVRTVERSMLLGAATTDSGGAWPLPRSSWGDSSELQPREPRLPLTCALHPPTSICLVPAPLSRACARARA